MVWPSLGKDYEKNAVNICKDLLLRDGKHLKTGRNTERPMLKTYMPELDARYDGYTGQI
jgi:hypothetical protein